MNARATLVVAAALAGALAFATAALAARSFSDAAGDSNAAPDVTGVTVSESAGGEMTFSVAVRNYQALPGESWINLWFDVDNNRQTGSGGDEALVQYFADGVIDLYRWEGSSLVRKPATGLSGSFAAGTLTLTVPKTAVGGVGSFGLLVLGLRAQGDGDSALVAGDSVPNSGIASYASPGPLTVPDPAGDQDEAPDITDVDVSDVKGGTVTFAIATPSHDTLPASTWMQLDFDLDRRRSTGDDGVEAYVDLEGGRVYSAHWSPEKKRFVQVRRSGVTARSSGGVVTFRLPRAFLRGVASFDFYVISGDSTGDRDLAIDLAPEGGRWWAYRLGHRPPVRLLAGAPTGAPARPVAGRRFGIALPVTRSDTAREIGSGSVACDVRVSGEKVRSIGSVKRGVARCSLLVPRAAAGARIQGSMTVRSGGASVRASFAFRAR